MLGFGPVEQVGRQRAGAAAVPAPQPAEGVPGPVLDRAQRAGGRPVQPDADSGRDPGGRVVVAGLQRGERLARLGPLQQHRAGVGVDGQQSDRAGPAEVLQRGDLEAQVAAGRGQLEHRRGAVGPDRAGHVVEAQPVRLAEAQLPPVRDAGQQARQRGQPGPAVVLAVHAEDGPDERRRQRVRDHAASPRSPVR
jgi:hypothetical protein